MKNRNFTLLSNQRLFYCWLIVLGMVFSLVACGGGGSSTGGLLPSPSPSMVTGVIQDAAGQPVERAQVQFAGQTLETAKDGRFSFTVNSSSASAVLLVKKSGFATNAKEVPANPGNTTDITVKIFTAQVSTFAASAGTTLSLANGASATIPANGLQTATGAAYAGTVMVGASYFGPDTLNGVQAFPAPYVGMDSGTQSPLITAGVIEVKLTDASGNPLQLKAGSPATLTYPASSVSRGASTIPMWYYDEASKMWVREGQAAQQTNGSYQASVAHFTIWNLDFKGQTATITGCLQDVLGRPVTYGGMMALRGAGWQSYWLGWPPSTDGNFTLLRAPAGIPLELFSGAQPAAFAPIAIPSLAPGEIRHLPCAVVTNPPAGSTVIVTPPSTLFTTSAGSFAGSYTGTYSGAETGTFAITVSPTGRITGTGTSQTFSFTFPVVGSVGASGNVSMAASGTAGSANFQGSASGDGGVSGTWMYTGGSLVGGGVFSGRRN